MKKALIGAGGFAREIKTHIGDENMVCFVDDQYYVNDINTLPLSKFNIEEYEVLIAIGSPIKRFEMVNKLPKETKYFTYIDKRAIILDKNIEIGNGSIICAGCILTTNIKIGKHAHLNLQTTIGHDTIIGDFFTSAPGAKISGNCLIHDLVYIGTNSSVREKININSFTTIGLNSGVVKHITEPGIYGGLPCKKIK
jgi:sugar O-acyltransferase (sialic acid O-acetyltransferase NeuD family)